MLDKNSVIGVVGSGAMGSGIAQVAATAGHSVIISDTNPEALQRSKNNLQTILTKLAEKQKISSEDKDKILARISFVNDSKKLKDSDLVIEAIIEDLSVKRSVFSELEKTVKNTCVLATNTSSLSITSIASACSDPSRVIGIHFFNPAPLMPLVEIVPGIATAKDLTISCRDLVTSWKKTTVVAKDTPGFIVNRVARPFYSEALRIYEEGIADIATIDWSVKKAGFKMGPFELMDLIGHDVNYVVTETVWKEFYYDPRFKPSLTQKRLLEAGFLGKKAGRGFYDYSPDATAPKPDPDNALADRIFSRIFSMLVNEAADALFMNIASAGDIDLAMTKGVNYPKGLLTWADEWGVKKVTDELQRLYDLYQEDRYRLCPLLKQRAKEGQKLFEG